MLIHPDRLFPAEPAAREVAHRLYADVRDLPIVSPHGHTDPRWFADERAVLGSGDAVRHSRPLHFPHALQPGRAARGSRHRHEGGRHRRARPARDLAPFRGALPSLSRHADADVARPHLRDPVRLHRAAHGGQCRRVLRQNRCRLEHAGIPPARAVRALPHRGHRHDGEPARSAEAPRNHPAIRLERPRGHGLSPRSGRRSGIRRFSGQSRALRRDHGLRHRDLERLSRRASQAARLLPGLRRDLHRSRPPDGAGPPIFRRPPPRLCSAACPRAMPGRRMRRCSAPRC